MNLLFSFLLTFTLAGCNWEHRSSGDEEKMNSASGLPNTALPRGRWGGQGITLDVGSQLSIFELDCAHGTIDGDFVSDPGGVVNSTGLIVLENAGPGGTPVTFRARFLGTFDFTQLHLVIDYIDSSPNLVQQQFDLRKGDVGLVRKCQVSF